MEQHLLIIGGSGFIGQALCREAIKQRIPVVSISRSGQPRDHNLLAHPDISWVKADILTDTNWHSYFEKASAVINLVGILRENKAKQLFYAEMIVKANHLIAAQARKYPVLPYLFLSANAGSPFVPKGYLASKNQAENDLASLVNPVIIFRPGLIVGRERPWTFVIGGLLTVLLQFPIIGKALQPVAPLKIKDLAQRVIAASETQPAVK